MPTPSADDLDRCRALLRAGSKSFFAASLLLPRRVRDPATALYAFCRVADDAVDESRRPEAALAVLSDRLDRVYAGRPRDDAVDRAFAAVVEHHDLPRALPAALLEGFGWDLAGRAYETAPDLDAYAVRVAGTVGMMMAVLMGRRSEAALARAADLGIAMQLTNIARDVGDDARAGRLYLPLDWLRAAGIDPAAFLASPRPGPEIAAVVARLLDRADAHYVRAAGGIALLPADCRPSIHAARLVYREIGRQVVRDGLDPVGRRSVVSGRRKAMLLAGACAASIGGIRRADDPPSDAAAALVRQVAIVPYRDGPVGRVVEIFTALHARERRQIDAIGRRLA